VTFQNVILSEFLKYHSKKHFKNFNCNEVTFKIIIFFLFIELSDFRMIYFCNIMLKYTTIFVVTLTAFITTLTVRGNYYTVMQV
jgi:hypothetical protein